MKELPHFHSWSNVPEDYHTKTKLRNEMGLKPIDESKHDATLKAYTNGKWRDFVLYHIDNTRQIKPRKVDISGFDFSEKNLSESLYRINKHAKKHRDAKVRNYEDRNYSVVNASKTKQLKYYDLKESVLKKMLEEKMAEVIGYHEMFDGFYLLIKAGEFTFHSPIMENQAKKHKNLGELTDKISSEMTRETEINFFQAEKLLKKYIEL